MVSVSAGVLCLAAGAVAAVDKVQGVDWAAAARRADPATAAAVSRSPEAFRGLLDQAPGTRFLVLDEKIRRVYGPALATGAGPVEAAQTFLSNYAPIFGVSAGDLVAWSMADNGSNVTPLMPDEQGGMKFNLVTYVQTHEGIPVFRGDVRVLARNTPENDVVWVGNALRPIDGFVMDRAILNAPAVQAAVSDAELRFPGLVGGTVTAPELTIWAGVDDDVVTPRLAVFFTATTAAGPDNEGYGKWIIVADAATGRMLWSESQIHQADVSGRVSGLSTSGIKAAECNPEVDFALPYARVTSGAVTGFADVNGNYTLTGVPSGSVTVSTSPRGRFFRTFNPSTDVAATSASGTGTVNIQLNSANTDQLVRAGVNAYVQANAIRDLILSASPAYPTISGQTEFRINVGVSGTCNAFYDGSSINFYNSGGGCSNTAFYDVVHHEYGHHVVNTGGSGQGQYGEGTSDCMGVLMSDQPILGIGFQSNCNAGIRNASNSILYPQDPGSTAIHTAGQLISGCLWKTRNEMVAAGTPNYRTILARLCINAVPLHSGSTIAPDITIDWMTLDDTDGNINNGTPNYPQIQAGFTEKNMPGPQLALLDFSFPNGLPTSLTPAQPTNIRVDVLGIAATPQDSTGQFTFRVGSGTDTTAAMTRIGVNQYVATIPAQACGSLVTYSFSARTTSGSTVTSPAGAPGAGYAATASFGSIVRFSDTFETNTGWTVTNSGLTDGPWGRGVPINETDPTRAAAVPAADFDGSGQCYLTDNVPGNSDVDGGSTTLTSPLLDASGSSTISYARWYSNHVGSEPESDTFLVEATGNNGATWTQLELVGPSGPEVRGGWVQRSIPLPPALQTSQFRIRFTARDLGGGSVVEAAVDAVSLSVTDCSPPPSCAADFNDDGFVDFFDYDTYVECYETGVCPSGKTADFNGDGFIDFFDYDQFVTDFESGC
jgi:Zn-dependent metalloprotease